MANGMTQLIWEEIRFVWEVRDFMDFREMAKDDPECSASRLESPDFGCFSLWLFPHGQEQHSSVGLIDLALMYRGKKNPIKAKWNACVLDDQGKAIPRSQLSDPLKNFSPSGDGRRFSYSPSAETLRTWIFNGTFRISCEVTIALACKSVAVLDPRKQNSSDKVDRLKSDVVQYALSPGSHDVRIWCGERKTECCRFLLAARSPVLRRMLMGPFTEAAAPEIRLTDICPIAASQMMRFIHTDKCEVLDDLPCTLSREKKKSRQDALMALIAAADKYDVQGLKEECEQRLAALMDEESVCDIVLFAEARSFTRLLEAGGENTEEMIRERISHKL
ncbi:hypothetical protein Esti_003636 [Eimeria stiedai]